MGNCDTCIKANKKKTSCRALRTMIGLAGECWAYTDDPDWMAKLHDDIEAYSSIKKNK